MCKNVKRTLSALLVLVMLVSTLCVSAFAAAPSWAHLEVGQADYSSLAVGSEVRVPVSLANLASGDYLAGYYCHLDNSTYLTVKSVEFTTEMDAWSGGYNASTQDINKVQLTAASVPTTAKHDNGLLFTVVYTVAQEIPAGTKVNPVISGVSLSKTSTEFLNTADRTTRPTADEQAASVVYPDAGVINVPVQQSFTVNVTATPGSVYMDETVTVQVKVNGGAFTGAYYTLSYEADKFELVSKPTDATQTGNSFKHTYLSYNAADGTAVGTYTFKALAQDVETTGYFTLGDYAVVETNESALTGNETAATVGTPAPVTILLKNDLTVSAPNVTQDFDGVPYGVVATANKTGATVLYKDASGNYTLTESPKYSTVGTHVIEFKATLKGYADAYGSATVTINVPKYYTESVEYVAGYSLVLVYTDQDGLDFTYGGRTMYDVTAANYSREGVKYEHVYGIVVKGTADMSNLAYTTGTARKIAYSTDVNASGKTDLKDAVNTVAVYNANAAYMTDAQMQLVLRADVNGSKTVDNADTNLILAAINR